MFFIKEDNVRSGNRGGRESFKWDDIRLMSYKERECYLGATSKLGYLDKGGKWRKHEFLPKPSNSKVEKEELIKERQRIIEEEEKLMNEKLGIEKKKPPQKTQEKLTDYEWAELMKKEAKFNVNDPKLYEFYENDEHKAGIGIKPVFSLKTNPYDLDKSNLTKLEGINYKTNPETSVKNNEDENPYEQATKNALNPKIQNLVSQYLSSKTNEQVNNEPKIIENSVHKDKNNRKSKSRSRDKKKKEKKEKKDKKEKKEKKKHHHRSRSRSNKKRH